MNLDEVREAMERIIELYRVYCEIIIDVGDNRIRQIHTF
jgi:hypothetical protein